MNGTGMSPACVIEPTLAPGHNPALPVQMGCLGGHILDRCRSATGIQMIDIAGSALRSYRFPAPRAEAFAFHRDVARSIGFLPHISIASHLGPDRYRLLYSATEASLYQVQIFCDVLAKVDATEQTILIRPLEGRMPIPHEAGLFSMTGRGRYASEIVFRPSGSATLVTYSLALSATLPVALSLRLLPGPLIATAADRILRRRMDEIMHRFVDRSIMAFGRRR